MVLMCDETNASTGVINWVGYTDGGRKLKLIVYEKRKALIRVITGWDV